MVHNPFKGKIREKRVSEGINDKDAPCQDVWAFFKEKDFFVAVLSIPVREVIIIGSSYADPPQIKLPEASSSCVALLKICEKPRPIKNHYQTVATSRALNDGSLHTGRMGLKSMTRTRLSIWLTFSTLEMFDILLVVSFAIEARTLAMNSMMKKHKCKDLSFMRICHFSITSSFAQRSVL